MFAEGIEFCFLPAVVVVGGMLQYESLAKYESCPLPVPPIFPPDWKSWRCFYSSQLFFTWPQYGPRSSKKETVKGKGGSQAMKGT